MMAYINGENIHVENITISEYLEKNRFDRNRVAVELNGSILKKKEYDNHVINDGDKIEIVCFVGGG